MPQTLADIRASLKAGKPAVRTIPASTSSKPTSLDAIRAQLKAGKSLNTGSAATKMPSLLPPLTDSSARLARLESVVNLLAGELIGRSDPAVGHKFTAALKS